MQNDHPTENNKVPNNPEAEEFRKSHWTIDAGINSGQIRAGEVDQEHIKFLETTTFAKEEVKKNE